MGAQGTLVAQGCHIVFKAIFAPGGVSFFLRRGERSEQAGKAGGRESGCGVDCLLHGLEDSARMWWEREEILIGMGKLIPDQEWRFVCFKMKRIN